MKKTLTAVAVAVCVVLVCFFVAASASELVISVESGNYIEYNVTYTGTLSAGHDVTWARMEILSVQNPNITVSITSRFKDNTNETSNYTLNLQTGHLIDDFIIPANLNVGDSFRDENLGNVTIQKEENQTYAGAERTVLSSTVGNNTYVWDQLTGVSVEGTSQTSLYTIHTLVSATNMWQPMPPQGLDFASLILLSAVVLIVAALVTAVVAHYRRKRACVRA